jgi:hypothetical protein
MKSFSVIIVNIICILGFFNIRGVKGFELLCDTIAGGKCSSIVEKSMQEKRPLSKGEYAYLVVKFENIVDSSGIIDDKPTQENNPTQENSSPQEQQQPNSEITSPEDNNNSNTSTSENNSSPTTTPSPENQGRDYLLDSLFNIDGDNEKESMAYVTSFNTDSEPTEVPTENSHLNDLFLEDGEYGDDECDDDCNDIKETETVDKNSNTFTNTTKSSNIKRSLIRKNEVIAEQRFAQFFVPVNEYSVLKIRSVKSRNWETEYIYVGLVHNKKVYYTHIPLRWATEKGCIEDRSITVVLEDGNYKSIEWGYTSCKAKSCKHGCLHDERNDENSDYKRCVNKDFVDNKCEINIYVGWAGTDKDGYVMLDSAQSIYEIKNTF